MSTPEHPGTLSPSDLSAWRWIVVNSSGGKDSQTALRAVVEACDRQGVSRSRIVVSHQDLGRMEWKGTRELVERQAAHYGLRLEVSKYRDKHGSELTLLDYVRTRGKWPDSEGPSTINVPQGGLLLAPGVEFGEHGAIARRIYSRVGMARRNHHPGGGVKRPGRVCALTLAPTHFRGNRGARAP